MAKSELINSFTILSKKIDHLIDERKRLLDKINELKKENDRLKTEQISDRHLLENAQKEIEFLTMSHRLAATPEALISARMKISQLIRTIDSCIRNLKED